NKYGDREFWAATVYGRGTSEWDFHKALMDTKFFLGVLKSCGFMVRNHGPEAQEPFNTVVVAEKGDAPPTYAQTMEVGYGPNAGTKVNVSV
ncbi:MAG: hypothetical protein WCC64_13200, partial [Aliidongia sp.]